MEKKPDNEREKLLLHSLSDVVKEEKTKVSTLQTNVSNLQTTVNALGNPPTKTSDLTNDSGFLTAHQDISGKENTANKTTTINQNSTNTQYPTALAVFNLMEENMINTTDLENGIDDLNTTNTNLKNTLNDKLQALTVAVRGIGADFTQVDAETSDVKSGKKFFDDDGLLQTGALATYSDSSTITANGTVATANKFLASDLTVAVPRPQLNAPTISISDDTLTITNPSANGSYVTSYKIYANNTLITTTSSTSVDLSDYLLLSGVYPITAKCSGLNFEDSTASESVNYIIGEITAFTSVSQITALLNDYQVESDFNTSAEEKLQFGSLLGNSPCAKIWFRQKPTNLSNEQLVLQFFITGLTSPSAIPATIQLNDTTIFSGNLTLVSGQNYLATCTINISSGFTAFNELTITFTDSTQANAYLDYVNISITGTQNCIILNRDTNFELYGLKRTSGVFKEYARKYSNGGNNYYVGGEDQDFTTTLTSKSFKYSTLNSESIKYAMAYMEQQYNESSGVYTFVITDSCYEVYITQSNTLYANWSGTSLTHTTTYNNVNYAKKSLHNGNMDYLEYICCSFQNFSVGLILFLYNQSYKTSTLTTLTLNNENLANEYIDIIPINNYYPSSITGKLAVGYFLLHKSGNIIFVPDVNSSYAILIGKGRQVTAYLESGGNGIHVYFNNGDNVIKKILSRETSSSTWELSGLTETYSNAKCIYERLTGSALKIYNGTISYLT